LHSNLSESLLFAKLLARITAGLITQAQGREGARSFFRLGVFATWRLCVKCFYYPYDPAIRGSIPSGIQDRFCLRLVPKPDFQARSLTVTAKSPERLVISFSAKSQSLAGELGGTGLFFGSAKQGSIAPQVVHSRQRLQPETLTA
jgi:hypothetical protein